MLLSGASPICVGCVRRACMFFAPVITVLSAAPRAFVVCFKPLDAFCLRKCLLFSELCEHLVETILLVFEKLIC